MKEYKKAPLNAYSALCFPSPCIICLHAHACLRKTTQRLYRIGNGSQEHDASANQMIVLYTLRGRLMAAEVPIHENASLGCKRSTRLWPVSSERREETSLGDGDIWKSINDCMQ